MCTPWVCRGYYSRADSISNQPEDYYGYYLRVGTIQRAGTIQGSTVFVLPFFFNVHNFANYGDLNTSLKTSVIKQNYCILR